MWTNDFLLRHELCMCKIFVPLDTFVYDTRIDCKIVTVVRYSNQELIFSLKQQMWAIKKLFHVLFKERRVLEE